MKLSIVTTLYHSAAYLEEFYRRISREAEKLTNDYELIFVNDGSPDASLDIVRSFLAHDVRVRIIDLSRNYGHHKAIMTGLSHTRGDLVLMIDCDLEEEPELLGAFFDKLQDTGADAVYGVVANRQGALLDRVSGAAFYFVYNLVTDHRIPTNPTLSRLMSRRYVDALVEHRDTEIFLLGLCVITGFLQVSIPVTKRHKGYTTYNLSRKVSAFVNAITSFSNRPLVFIFYLGGAISAIASIVGLTLIVRKLFFRDFLVGWPSLIVSIWLLGGLMIFSTGLIGIYLSKVFMETKRRPFTVIRAVYGELREARARAESSPAAVGTPTEELHR